MLLDIVSSRLTSNDNALVLPFTTKPLVSVPALNCGTGTLTVSSFESEPLNTKDYVYFDASKVPVSTEL